MTANQNGRDEAASGYICPRCGGALWTKRNGDSLQFECRIGDAFSAAQVWIEHSAGRNQSLKAAGRALAENAALARKLADWARDHGNHAAAEKLLQEATDGEQLHRQVSRMLEGLPSADHAPGLDLREF